MRYRCSTCVYAQSESGELRSRIGFTIGTRYGLHELERAAIVVLVPSWRDAREPAPEPLLAALRRAHRRGALIVGLCLGAYVLAEAGLLDGRRATTHWRWTELFTQRFPQVRVEPSVLYVDEGDVLTSAGTAAGIDCCLHVVRQQFGAEGEQSRIARTLVVPPHRRGSRAQYIEQPVLATASDNPPNEDTELGRTPPGYATQPPDSLATKALMSRRSFHPGISASTPSTTVGQ